MKTTILCFAQGKYSICDNNCKGVNPNAIIGAGVAAVGIVGIAAQSLVGPAAGLGVGGVAGSFHLIDFNSI